ncbi:MAG TPA: phage tail protein [Nannocystis exedens]|nr:phage tail protein [Nannocystis exedens]
MDGTIGEIRLFAGNFAPHSWALCDGQLLAIIENQALFSVLGTTYGGDGRHSFALPDLRGRAPVHVGRGPGLSPYQLGERKGRESTQLSVNQLPSHRHTLAVSGEDPTTKQASQGLPATGEFYNPQGNENAPSEAVGATGGGEAVPVIQPVLALNYIICVQGRFPSRN